MSDILRHYHGYIPYIFILFLDSLWKSSSKSSLSQYWLRSVQQHFRNSLKKWLVKCRISNFQIDKRSMLRNLKQVVNNIIVESLILALMSFGVDAVPVAARVVVEQRRRPGLLHAVRRQAPQHDRDAPAPVLLCEHALWKHTMVYTHIYSKNG